MEIVALPIAILATYFFRAESFITSMGPDELSLLVMAKWIIDGNFPYDVKRHQELTRANPKSQHRVGWARCSCAGRGQEGEGAPAAARGAVDRCDRVAFRGAGTGSDGGRARGVFAAANLIRRVGVRGQKSARVTSRMASCWRAA